MADGNLRNDTFTAPQRYFADVTLIAGTDFCIDLGVPTDTCDAVEFRKLSIQLAEMASGALQMLVARGDNDADLPETLTHATQGAAVLLRLSIGFHKAADQLDAQA